MNHQENSRQLTSAPIPKLIKQIAIPASVGFFFNTMYNVVDTYFGGLISTTAIAALSLSFPVFFLIIAFGSGLGTGATALISNALGKQDEAKARHYTAQALSFSIIISIALTILGLTIAPFLFQILGAEGTYLTEALSYINVIFYGTIFFVFTFILNAILNAVGDTKSFRNFLIIGFFINPFLNYWFMFGGLGVPALGLAGIALATVVVQFIGVIYLFPRVLKTKLFDHRLWRQIKPESSAYKDLIKQGFPASLNMMTVAIGIFVITYFASWFGKGAVAAYGVATRIEQIILLPGIGLNIAALTLIGQNNGAGKFDRIKETLRKCLIYSAYIALVGTVILFLFAAPLMKIFTKDLEVINFGADYLKIAAFMTLAYPILFIITSALQGLKKPMFALWIGLFRQIIAPIIIFYSFIKILNLGIFGLWWGIFIIVWSSALIAVWYSKKTIKKISQI
jgi:putative MATE family efflux protein